MNIFEFDDYKTIIKLLIKEMPKKGYGEVRKIAQHLRIHSTLLSQILNGDRHLTMDQAYSLSAYFGLDTIETKYFLILIQKARAYTSDPTSH